MQTRIVFVQVVCAVAALAAVAAAGGAPCGSPGELRCDADGRHVSGCTRGGTWLRLMDCGDATCADGQCVRAREARNSIGGKCDTYKELSCSDDCAYVLECALNGRWMFVEACPTDTVCTDGECVDGDVCVVENAPYCGVGSENQTFPDLNNCDQFFTCGKMGSQGLLTQCQGDSELCDIYKPCNGTNDGRVYSVPGNPQQYYYCTGGNTYFSSCKSDEYYESESGDCIAVRNPSCTPKNVANSSPSDTSTSITCTPGEKWADPSTECKYQLCYASGANNVTIVTMTCPSNTKYDVTAQTCVSSSGSCT